MMIRTRNLLTLLATTALVSAYMVGCGGSGGGGTLWIAGNAPEMAVPTTDALQANRSSYDVSLNGDGRYVVFSSSATNLVTGVGNGTTIQVFRRDRVTGTTVLVSKSASGVAGDEESSNPSISDDGRYVAFSSYATNLTSVVVSPAHTQVYVADMQTGTITLISATPAGAPANDTSVNPFICGNGSRVAWSSIATDLIAVGTSKDIPLYQVYVRDLGTGDVRRISSSSSGAPADGFGADHPRMSDDGRFTVFNSSATNLHTDVSAGTRYHLYLYDWTTGTLTVESRATNGDLADNDVYRCGLSGNGSWLVFDSAATNLATGAVGIFHRIYIRNLLTGETTAITDGAVYCADPAVTDDGAYVVYRKDRGSSYMNVFLYRASTNETRQVNVTPTGASPANGEADYGVHPLSDAGAYIGFSSDSTDLLDIGATGATYLVYVYPNEFMLQP